VSGSSEGQGLHLSEPEHRNGVTEEPRQQSTFEVHAETHLNCCETFQSDGEAGREIIAPNIAIVFGFYFAMTVTHIMSSV